MKVDDLRISIKGLGHEESDKEGHYGQNINNVHPVLDNDYNDADNDYKTQSRIAFYLLLG